MVKTTGSVSAGDFAGICNAALIVSIMVVLAIPDRYTKGLTLFGCRKRRIEPNPLAAAMVLPQPVPFQG